MLKFGTRHICLLSFLLFNIILETNVVSQENTIYDISNEEKNFYFMIASYNNNWKKWDILLNTIRSTKTIWLDGCIKQIYKKVLFLYWQPVGNENGGKSQKLKNYTVPKKNIAKKLQDLGKKKKKKYKCIK